MRSHADAEGSSSATGSSSTCCGRTSPPRTASVLTRIFGRIPQQLEPGVYDGDGAQLVVRRLFGDPPLLALDERRLRPDPVGVRALGLSAREAEVLALVARGLADAAIAQELFVSPRTVAKHLQNAYAKLGVHSRSDAASKLLGS